MLRKLIELIIPKRCNKSRFYGLRKLHTTAQSLVKEATDNRPVYSISEILNKYTTEQEEKILKIINTSNLNEILCYEITKGKANKLLVWRMCNGLFKNLNDVFSIEGFGIKMVDKFLQSLLLEPRRDGFGGKCRFRSSSFITPSLEAEQIQSIRSCVSVRIGVNSITWSHLDVPGQDANVPCVLTDWQHYEISEKMLHLSELIQRCLHFHSLIPMADCYIFESPQMVISGNNLSNAHQQNINIQKSQVIAIMGYALAARNKQKKDIRDNVSNKKSIHMPSIFYVKRFLTGRLFNLLVGNETVSSEQIISNMMRTFYNTNGVQQFNCSHIHFSGQVQFPTELREMFSKAPRHSREFLGRTLLLNLTFVRLVLLQDSHSIDTVSRNCKLNSATDIET